MPSDARKTVVDQDEAGVYHVWDAVSAEPDYVAPIRSAERITTIVGIGSVTMKRPSPRCSRSTSASTLRCVPDVRVGLSINASTSGSVVNTGV